MQPGRHGRIGHDERRVCNFEQSSPGSATLQADAGQVVSAAAFGSAYDAGKD